MKNLFGIFKREPSLLENVTPRVQRILLAARNEADRRFHQYVGSEHLWGGFLIYNEGVGIEILRALKVDIDVLKCGYSASMKAGPPREPRASIPCTPKFKAILAKGEKEARKLEFTYFGSEHLVLGFLSRGGIARDSLNRQSVDYERYRLELVQRIQKK
jgi:ATP-dependent Clp protease ATP-binding subunit ClpC